MLARDGWRLDTDGGVGELRARFGVLPNAGYEFYRVATALLPER